MLEHIDNKGVRIYLIIRGKHLFVCYFTKLKLGFRAEVVWAILK